jgi:NifB/MoaA-like Fe-S oxidoreductase
LLTADEAGHAIDQVERARGRALAERGEGWCYAADEMFLIAGRELPAPDYYDDGSLTENGVGAVRALLDDLDAALDAPPDAPTGALPRLDGQRLRIATGSSMAPFFRERAPALAERTGAAVDVVEVANDFFGPTVGVAGLLAGGDLVRALAPGTRTDDVVLLPAEALNAERLFIDSVPLAHVEASLAPARVEPGHLLSELLRRL